MISVEVVPPVALRTSRLGHKSRSVMQIGNLVDTGCPLSCHAENFFLKNRHSKKITRPKISPMTREQEIVSLQ